VLNRSIGPLACHFGKGLAFFGFHCASVRRFSSPGRSRPVQSWAVTRVHPSQTDITSPYWHPGFSSCA
jgi:hypothetical protein